MRDDNRRDNDSKRSFNRGPREWIGPTIDYKDVELLRKFMTSSSKLMSRRRTGTSAQEQCALKQAVKRARFLALIPFRGI